MGISAKNIVVHAWLGITTQRWSTTSGNRWKKFGNTDPEYTIYERIS